jgi:hypothetical protein
VAAGKVASAHRSPPPWCRSEREGISVSASSNISMPSEIGVGSAITDPIDVSGLISRTTYSRHAYVSDPLIQVADPHPVRITIIMERAPLTSAPPRSQ